MKKRTINFLSFLYTVFIITGISYLKEGTLKYIIRKPLNITMFIFLFIILIILFKYILIKINYYLEKYKEKKDKPHNRILLLFDEHPIAFSIIFMIICWLPYIIAYYPGILNKDNVYQVKQFFGIDNKYSYYVNLIDKNQIITNHHPYLHTILLGTCIKIGMRMNNVNLGFFIFTSLQSLLFLLTMSYSIYYLKKNNINYKYRFILLLIYSLVPLFPFYAITLVKDSIYSCFFLLYIIILHSIVKNKLNINNMVQIVIISILLFLFRNNGFYIFLLSFPFLLIKNKKKFNYIIVILIVFFSYEAYNKVILPSLKVTPTSIRETLSIPFQQTARYIKYHEKDISKKDKEDINNILDYNKIKKVYNPELSDPVKSTFNKDYKKEDLIAYFKVWFKGLIKHPGTYIEATLENTYGYYCPLKNNWYIYYKYQDKLKKEDNISYHYNNLSNLRDITSSWGVIFPYIPALGLIANIGFNTWLIIFIIFYLIDKKRYKDIIYILPCIAGLLVCIASPANTYFRYALPNIMSIPIILLLVFNKKRLIVKKG